MKPVGYAVIVSVPTIKILTVVGPGASGCPSDSRVTTGIVVVYFSRSASSLFLYTSSLASILWFLLENMSALL